MSKTPQHCGKSSKINTAESANCLCCSVFFTVFVLYLFYFVFLCFVLFCFVFFFHNRHFFLFSDSVTFTIFLTHDALSSDHAWNVVLVWILPHYARFLRHVPKKNITNPYPGEYQIKVGYIMDDFLVFYTGSKNFAPKNSLK